MVIGIPDSGHDRVAPGGHERLSRVPASYLTKVMRTVSVTPAASIRHT